MQKTKLILAVLILTASQAFSNFSKTSEIIYKDLSFCAYEMPRDNEKNSYNSSGEFSKITEDDKPCPKDTTKITNIDLELVDSKFKNGCLAGQAKLMVRIAREHGISPHFFIALIAHESAYGKSRLARTKNNFGGVKLKKGGYKSFSSIEEGLTYIAVLIRDYYHAQDRISVARIHAKYCPGGGSNKRWGSKVVMLMNSFHKETK